MVTTGMDLLIRPGIGLGLCVREYTIESRLGSTRLDRIRDWKNLLRLQQLSSASAETRNEYSRSRNHSQSSTLIPVPHRISSGRQTNAAASDGNAQRVAGVVRWAGEKEQGAHASPSR